MDGWLFFIVFGSAYIYEATFFYRRKKESFVSFQSYILTYLKLGHHTVMHWGRLIIGQSIWLTNVPILVKTVVVFRLAGLFALIHLYSGLKHKSCYKLANTP